ncbi:hypothetical protein B0H14DRAFT_2667109 [Mycena olivaceomarginata]|nr:hypothetical protein B0H14DRAFT_2667109 [Mycena olivaceomarginata]
MQRDSLALSRPRKRPRANSIDSDGAEVTLIEEPASVKIVRDPVYYNPSGDCKILVEDTLFCIHRFLLERDSATFQTMFQLPQGAHAPQGSTDEDPIVLMGDTVAQFRALCWALYALPNEIVKATTSNKSIEKLAELATISQKYQLAAFESWSMDSVQSQCQVSGSAATFLLTCPPHLLPLLLRLSVLYGDDTLLKRIISAWVSRLTTTPLTPSYLPVVEFSTALRSAEDNNLRDFLGQLYYARLRIAHRDSVTPHTDLPFQDLEPRHLGRILRGSWLLSTMWQKLRPELPQGPGVQCTHHSYACVPEWKRLWAEAGTKEGAADVKGKLNWVHNSLPSGRHGEMITLQCAERGKAIVKKLKKQVDQALPDYFLGPP